MFAFAANFAARIARAQSDGYASRAAGKLDLTINLKTARALKLDEYRRRFSLAPTK